MKIEETRVSNHVWHGADAEHAVLCTPELAGSIAAAAWDNFRRLARGGLEIGGVLLGRRTPAGLQLGEWIPIPCEHARGPAFLLSPADEAALKSVLAGAAARNGVEVLGWFVSHGRSELAVTDADLDIFKRFFPEPWQVALILKPSMELSARARIGSLTGSETLLGPEFEIAFLKSKGVERGQRSGKVIQIPAGRGAERPVRIRRIAGDIPTAPCGASTAYPVRIGPLTVPARRASGFNHVMMIAASGLCLLVAAFVIGVNFKLLTPRPAAVLGLRAIATGHKLRVEWAPSSALIRQSQSATIDVNDGGATTRLLLDSKRLRRGSFDFLHQSDDVEFVFTLHSPNRQPVLEWARFIGPLAPTASRLDPRDVERLRETPHSSPRLPLSPESQTKRPVARDATVWRRFQKPVAVTQLRK